MNTNRGGAAPLPAVAPEVLADAVAALPARLRKRLDETVELAAGWPVSGGGDAVRVGVDDRVTVTLTVPVATAADAACSCLLSPRCLHRAAILARCPVLDTGGPPATPTEPPDAPLQTAEEQRRAAGRLWRAAADLLEYGTTGAGAVVQATILRGVHDARTAGLPRPATLGVRVVEQIRSARAGEPQHRLGSLTDDLRELLAACRTLATGHGDQPIACGTARRDYRPVGNLRLYGLCSEPVLTTSGYAGVVTYLCDQHQRLWTIGSIQPGGASLAQTAGDSLVTIGDARPSHRALGREGLVVSNAHATVDGRLSLGRQVQAVSAAGCRWDADPAGELWRPPLATQATRYHDALAVPRPDRPAGHDLAFITGEVRGRSRHGLLVADSGAALTVTIVPPVDDPALPYVPNLRLLAEHARGHPVRLIGRFAGPRRLQAIALAADWLPDRLGGHADLGIDALQRTDAPGAAGNAEPATEATADPLPSPLLLLRHRLERTVAGGRITLTATVSEPLPLPIATKVLANLHAVAGQRDRDAFGRLNPYDTDRLAGAWLTAAVYEAAAARRLAAAQW